MEYDAESLLFALMNLATGTCLQHVSGAHPHVVPDASAYVLAPMGLAAILVVRQRRRRADRIRQGVGRAYFALKRLFDISVAMALMAILSPVFALIAVLVSLDSPGPVIYRRRVIGKYGKSFDMLKFRSMVADAERVLAQDAELEKRYREKFKLCDDPRVTRLGGFLRRTSLDELPQLVNVLLGSMTFVGPRPIHSEEVGLYGPEVERFMTVTPGITCLWQVCGRSNTSYQDRVQMDMLYIEKRSIVLDLWIVFWTIPAVLLRRGAC